MAARRPNELKKTMTDKEFQNVKMWVNEILTGNTSRLRARMNCTMSQIYKGGCTNEMSNQRPVILLNSVYHVLNYVIKERLKKNVEQGNIFEPGHFGNRQRRCLSITMQKMHFIQQVCKCCHLTGCLLSDQKGDNQRDDNSYQLHIGYTDDISIFADTPQGMQKLLDVVKEFTWFGMQINVNNTYLLVIDNDKKRREQESAPLLTINGEILQAKNFDDACRFLGYRGTGYGHMEAIKDLVRRKIIAAHDLINAILSHSELATELFTNKSMGVLRFSLAFME